MVEAVSVEAIGASGAPAEVIAPAVPREGALARRETVRMFGGGEWHDTGLYQRADLRIGDVIEDMLTGMLTVIRTNDRALAERVHVTVTAPGPGFASGSCSRSTILTT